MLGCQHRDAQPSAGHEGVSPVLGLLTGRSLDKQRAENDLLEAELEMAKR